MARIFPGRYTAQVDGPFVVFVIGMRINRLRAVRSWWPVASAMRPMLETLLRHPEKGFLGGQTLLAWRGVVMIQYWRSFEELDRFARDPAEPHLPAWRRFNQASDRDGAVGIFHESYLVEAGRHESIYGDMPRVGLAAAFGHVPAVGHRATARRRLGREDPDPPVEAY